MPRYLGLDLGTVTLGVAISRTGIIASGYEEYRFPSKEWHIALQEAVRIVKLEEIQVVVIGLPLNMSGTESEMSGYCRAFGKMIQDELADVKVVFEDERLSTQTATGYLLEGDLSRAKRRKVIDKVAAQVILESYLERESEK
jgi:putative Holliday junction resolvase